MSFALSVHHGVFGRASIYTLDRPITTHAHHDGHLIFHLGDAGGMLGIGNAVHAISPDCGVAINPWAPHRYIPGDAARPSTFLTLYIDPAWFSRIGCRDDQRLWFGRTGIDMTPRLRVLVRACATVLLEQTAPGAFDDLLFALASESIKQSWGREREAAAGPDGQAIGDFRVRKSIQLMKERLCSEMALDDVARDSGLSRPHFYKLFRQRTGLTPGIYVNMLLMEKAIGAVTGSRRSITQIGFDLGFSSQSCFTRFFAANVGLAPTEYRRVAHLALH